MRIKNTPVACPAVRYYDARFKSDQDSSGIDNMTSHADEKQSNGNVISASSQFSAGAAFM